MKSIVFIISDITDSGGMQRVTINIANHLADMNKYKVHVISLTPGDGQIKYAVNDRVKVDYLPIPNFYLRRDWLKAIKEIRKFFSNDFSGTVVVDDVGYTISAYAALHSHKGIKLVCWTHTNYYHGRKYGFAWTGRRLAVSKFDKVIALTKEDREYYRQIDKKGIVIQIYNPIDKDIVRGEYLIDSKKIISCGRLDRIKGFDYLIEAARLVFHRHPDWRWDIYGDGEEFDNLKNSIHQYGLENNIFLMGYHKDILSLYKEYSMYVFTSRGEGCPMAMIEAQSAGLPMVSFDFKCGPKDLVTECVNGFVIKNYSVEEMAKKINYLIENPGERKRFSQNSSVNLNELKLDYVLEKWQRLFDAL